MSLPELEMKLETGEYTHSSAYRSSGHIQKTKYDIVKRWMDVIGSIAGMAVLLPLFLVVALLIKLEDPKGRIIYQQIRVGKNGKPFQMYKFRSMVANAEELLPSLLHLNERAGAVFKMEKDPRVTRIGRFIRQTSIDELPQFLNVLKGEMSLVGPRPPLPVEVENYTSYDRQRLQVTPGCTGLWQVSGRNKIGFQDMVELDLKYIADRSFWLDIKLIFRTINIMIWSRDGH